MSGGAAGWDKDQFASVTLYRKRVITLAAHVPFAVAYAWAFYACYTTIGLPYKVSK